MVFIKRKTIEKYKKISFLGQVWGKDIFDSNKTPFLTIIEKIKGAIINKTPFLTIMSNDSPSLFFKKTLF